MASRRIFRDVEEALSREVRRITYHDARTLDRTVLRETYDTFSGEVISVPIEPEFYDSSADAGGVQYPHFFIRLLKTREDRFTGRVVPQYGQWLRAPIITSPKAFQIVLSGSSALVPVIGNDVTITAFQIRKVLVGHLLRLTTGNNKGTYTISAITINPSGDHTLTLSNTIVASLPALVFNSVSRIVQFQGNIDLNTVKINDTFTDSGSNTFNITAIDAANGNITINGSLTPLSSQGGIITRTGNVLTSTDLSPVGFLVLDPSQPIQVATIYGDTSATGQTAGTSPPVPIDAYYLIRIDSKARDNHIDILNRVWEEFNPPRTALPIIARSALSAEQLLTVDVTTGGSNTVLIADSSNYKVGDSVFIFDDIHPVMQKDGKLMERPFESKIIDIPSSTQLVMADVVPDTYKISNCAKVVSNSEFQLLMFNFVDHVTKDVEGSQYWVHEFTFWVQIFVDRYETPNITTVVTDFSIPIENMTGNVLLDDI